MTSLAETWWIYVLVFVCVAASWAGVPAIGGLAAAAAGVAASQGRLELGWVIFVVTVAGEVGGLIGYHIGFRWGRELVRRPGKHHASRERTLERGESLYARWGRVAVFVTPAIVSGTAKMELRQFAVWNLLASFGFALLTVAGAYGLVRIGTGHHSAADLSTLVLSVGAGLVIFEIARRHRRPRDGR